jgi:hypothetical protein
MKGTSSYFYVAYVAYKRYYKFRLRKVGSFTSKEIVRRSFGLLVDRIVHEYCGV